MVLTAELSLYPLRADYVDTILAFIDELRRDGSLVVCTNAMSTQIKGEHDAVIGAVSAALKLTRSRCPEQVLVCKFLPLDLDIATT